MVASSLNNTGVICQYSGDFDKAIVNHLRSLNIRKKLYGGKHPNLAENYVNTAFSYRSKGDQEKALDYYLLVPEIFRESGNEPPVLASAYAGIGGLYIEKGEYNRGLEYLLKAADIRKKLFGDSHIDVAETMTSIGAAYYSMHEYDKALTYYQSSVNILSRIFGPKHPSLAEVYSNIGILYDETGNYDEALNYHFLALGITRELLGEKHPSTGRIYNNAGNSYTGKGEYDNALDYYSRALANNRAVYGDKHALVSQIYWNMASVYEKKGDFDKALRYYQKAAGASSPKFNDTTDIRRLPIANAISWKYLIESLNKKAVLLADLRRPVSGMSAEQRIKSALEHYQVCDTLIDITRRKISSLDDKLALGEISSQISKQAVDLLTSTKPGTKKITDRNAKMAFYFSEKNKSAVLLEALAGQEAQHFSGIPDSLLEKEHDLKSEIAYYAGKITEAGLADSLEIRKYKDVVFKRNLSLDSLIKVFEIQYPDYHNLKYNTYCRGVRDIQKLLDSKTALISYFLGDSTITIFTVTKSKFNVTKVPRIVNIDSIGWLRYGLINTSQRMQKTYSRLGYKLYNQLFPENLLMGQHIENLVIIPDGELAIIPFEALLTEAPGDYFGDYSKYPYLVKKYNISYSYSANLFYLTSNRKSNNSAGLTNLNDWLAVAPVFEEKEVKMTKFSTYELSRQLSWLKTDSSLVRSNMFS
ncbi:MAG TPA: tetratricopeptide repeat protein, partial [Bacteroidales bacterium]|nr:tetratricopeptide repeat protein [Bacteroidales bacterium]